MSTRLLASLVLPLLFAAGPATACVGDCGGKGSVNVSDLVVGVGIALGQMPMDACAAFDRDGDGEVRIDELLAGVTNALNGCPTETTPTPAPSPTPTPVSLETRCQIAPGDGVSFDPDEPFCEYLSSYRFFVGDGAAQIPNQGVLPYDLNTALFSDYAEKHRFVWMPPGTSAAYDRRDSFDFPIGTVVIKTFAYPFDFRDPSLGQRVLETRLIVRRAAGWDPVTYLWNGEQNEARRRVIGARLPVSWIDEQGATRAIDYQVPNTNQCRTCHDEHNDVLGVLGPKARHLNEDYPYDDGVENQLARWTAVGYLSGAPDPAAAPRVPAFDDPEDGTLEERARAYLDVNCGNCHNPTGAARTSGLYLDIDERTPLRLGVCKPPVAAGQGSGNLRYDIVPGQPDQSILVFRMESTAPGIAMPELGRQTTHEEALEVIRAWILDLPGDCE